MEEGEIMTEQEVIIAAENCIKGGGCENCPYDGCRDMTRDLLDIIKKLKGE